MAEKTSGEAVEVNVQFAPGEHEALATAARRLDLPVPELAHALVVYGIAALARGDSEIQRAVKGSRDAAVR